jgi:putative ABC transport system permease protein
MANLPFSNIFYRKTRTGIGILSVAIEVALVVVVVGLVHGTMNEYADRVKNVGADIIFQGPDSSPFFALNSGVMPVQLTEKLGEIAGVDTVAPVLLGRITNLKGVNKLVTIFGVDAASYNRVGNGIRIIEGHGLEEPNDIVVDTVLSEADDVHVGDTLTIMNREFTVSGICRAGAGSRLFIDIQVMGEGTAQPGKASFFFLEVDSASDIGEVAAKLENNFEGYQVTMLSGFADAMMEQAFGLQEFINVLSLLAVLISFLVILLAMYTTVIERTREIGILKALGAGKTYIIRLVMAESFIICAIGVVFGYVISVVGRHFMLQMFPTLTVDLMPQWFLIAAILGIGGGLLGALYPAFRAAQLDPVEALNFE